jgi:membrane protease YdiL (CAAX protease family)
MKKYLKAVINVLQYLSIYFVIILVVVAFFNMYLNYPLFISRITSWILTILCCNLWLMFKKDNLIIRCNFTSIRWKDVLSPFLVVGGVDFLIFYIFFNFKFLPNVLPTKEAIELVQLNQFLAYLILGLMGPVFEEIFYRGLIFNEFRNNFSTVTAILLQAIIFGILHEVPEMVYSFIAGILYSVLYLWLKTIWAPIIAHIINYNLYLHSSTLIKLNSCCYGLPYILPMLAMLIVSIYLLWKNRDEIFYKHNKID